MCKVIMTFFLYRAQDQLVTIFMEYSQITIFKFPNNEQSMHLEKLNHFLNEATLAKVQT